jgi:hypothetical protein
MRQRSTEETYLQNILDTILEYRDPIISAFGDGYIVNYEINRHTYQCIITHEEIDFTTPETTKQTIQNILHRDSEPQWPTKSPSN